LSNESSTTYSWYGVLTAHSLKRNLVLSALLLASMAGSSVIGGVRFTDSIRLEGTSLRLVGTGLQRYMVIYKVCVAGLYLPASTRPGDALTDVAKRLEIEYFHEIRADQFATLTRKGVQANATQTEFRRVEARLESFVGAYKNVVPGDRYSLTYIPEKGTTLALNGRPLATIEGADFARALYAVWLGAKPVTEGLRAGLLQQN